LAAKILLTGGGLWDKIQQVCGYLLLKNLFNLLSSSLLEKQAVFFTCF
jgi:hypothetical protein